uniref:Uncharacterized protein n=1 Tax=Panagrolaimus sp. JU765 TaxID=591449 RepID=A0AC34R4Y3_9BILA
MLEIQSMGYFNIAVKKSFQLLFCSGTEMIFCIKTKEKTAKSQIFCPENYCEVHGNVNGNKFSLKINGSGQKYFDRKSSCYKFEVTTEMIIYENKNWTCRWDVHEKGYLEFVIPKESGELKLIGAKIYNHSWNSKYVESSCCPNVNQHRYNLPGIFTWKNIELPLSILLVETFILLVCRITYGILVIQKLRRKIVYVTPTLCFDESYFDEND